MTKTTNKIQAHYMIAKAHLETLEAHEKELEHQYIIDNGITNADGSIPKFIYCIENETTFDKANEEQAKIIEDSGLWNKILIARKTLKIAEAKLIEYGLSIVPALEREILAKACQTNFTTRMKVIDLVLKLDVSTVTV